MHQNIQLIVAAFGKWMLRLVHEWLRLISNGCIPWVYAVFDRCMYTLVYSVFILAINCDRICEKGQYPAFYES